MVLWEQGSRATPQSTAVDPVINRRSFDSREDFMKFYADGRLRQRRWPLQRDDMSPRRPQKPLAASAVRRTSATTSSRWQPARRSRKSPLHHAGAGLGSGGLAEPRANRRALLLLL